MSTRPVIFISAVSRELKSARQLVANTLTFLGYEPEWQDTFGLEEGDLRAVLRRRIDASKGVVQLVGECYGAEPPSIDEQFGRVSYTQYEGLYAASKNKKVWYLFLDIGFPTDAHEEEEEEKRKLQEAYRKRLKADAHLYHPLSNKEGLEASVLKLRDDLTRLRRGVRRWATAVGVLLGLSVGLTVWLLQKQQHVGEQQEKTTQQVQALQEKIDKLEQGIASFTEIETKVRQEQPDQKPQAIEEKTYEELGKQLGIDAKTLKEQLPRFAQELKMSPNATTYERANAAYVAKDYNEAERLALAAADEAQRANPAKTGDAVKALELAGWAAEKRIEYSDALERLRSAEKLTERTRDPVEWARLQSAIAAVLYDQGKYHDAEGTLRNVIGERERSLGLEQPETLTAHHTLAVVLWAEGKFPEAEAENRAALNLQEKVLGPEHPDTLKTRNSLATTLREQGKYADAEVEYRVLITLWTKIFGPEARETAIARGNLAIVLNDQAKYAEAEKEFRTALAIDEKVLGAEHPETLLVRSNLAGLLTDEAKYAQAEAEARAVIALWEKVLGPEHPDTLLSHHNLAGALAGEGRYAEAEQESRKLINLEEKVYGREHPETLTSRSNLAETLLELGRYTEVESEACAVIKLEEKVLGREHPDTLETRTILVRTLDAQGKSVEAEGEARAVLQLQQKALGAEHPDTLETRASLANALRSQGKYSEADTEDRTVLTLREKVLWPQHPDTLRTCFDLALCLRAEKKISEAKTYAQRAAEGARKLLGPEHPDTKKYDKLCAELLGT